MSKLKKRFFLSFILIALIPTVFAFGGFVRGAQMVENITNVSYVERLSQTIDEIERALGSISNLSKTLAKTTWVKRIAYMQGTKIDYGQIGPYALSQYALEIGNYISMNSLVEDIGIAFNRKKIILSVHGVDSYDWFFSRAYQAEGMTAAQWTELLDSNTDHWLYPQTVKLYNRTDRYMTYIKSIFLYSDNVISAPSLYENQLGTATLIIMIREEDIAELLGGMIQTQGSSAYILDQDHQQVISRNANPQVLAAIQNMPDSDSGPYRFHTAQYGDMYAYSVTSGDNGWRYIAVLPVSEVASKAYLIQYSVAVFALILCTLLAVGAVAWRLAKKNYAPIKNIIQNIERQTGSSTHLSKKENEYQYINGMLESYYHSNVDLAHRAQVYTPFVLHSLFVKLLYGVITNEGIELMRNIPEISNTEDPWNVMVFLWPAPGTESIFRSQINKISIQPDCAAYVLSIEQQKLAVVTNARARPQLMEVIHAVIASCYYLAELPLHVGVGRHASSLWDISTSFGQANRALLFEPAAEEKLNVSYFDDIARTGEGKGFLAYREADVMALVQKNNPQEIAGMIDSLRQQGGHSSEQSLLNVQCLYYNLLNTALKLMRENQLDTQRAVGDRDYTATHSARVMKENILALYQTVCAGLQARKENAAARRREDILGTIMKRCSDDSLTLQELADQFGVSMPYLSKYIKQQTGENFVDFVGKKRIELAKARLQQSEDTIEQIGRDVGYYNALTFRRAFKKYEGITPGAYREQMKRKKHE